MGLWASFLSSFNQRLARQPTVSARRQRLHRAGPSSYLLCHLTHSKLLFMNSGRRQSKGSHCLVTSDICKVQSSFHAAWRAQGSGGLLDPGPGLGLSASASGAHRGDVRRDTGGGGQGALQRPVPGPRCWFRAVVSFSLKLMQ